MIDTSQIFKELGIPYFREVFEIIDRTMMAHGVPYYLVGATSLALQLLQKGQRPMRATRDVDFAIMIGSNKQYDAIVDSLVEEGFAKFNVPHRIQHRGYHTMVDLLPFGDIEENDTVHFNNREVELHVLGFNQVLKEAKELTIEGFQLKVPPMEGMIVLKMVAWSDRPEHRGSDLDDILLIIKRYFDFAEDEIYEHHHDLFGSDDFDFNRISAQVLGRKAGEILNRYDPLKNRILGVLEKELISQESSKIALQWARIMDQTVEHTQKILESFMNGLREGMITS
ncbi:MAG: nucleotidyl transferase AbiEii/AbiGii toxin family protein [Flavobacteriales bacterium]|nr:nucleotidyl transferase AbiEii/AbiGii toxin family protein [Flavobacteriales bacterium]